MCLSGGSRNQAIPLLTLQSKTIRRVRENAGAFGAPYGLRVDRRKGRRALLRGVSARNVIRANLNTSLSIHSATY